MSHTFARHGFSYHTVGEHSLRESDYAGRHCVECTLTNEDDANGQWGDTPAQKLWRSQLSSNCTTRYNADELIRFSTCIPDEWVVKQPGVFVQDGKHPEQTELFNMHSTGSESIPLGLWLVGDHLVLWLKGAIIWQGLYVPNQWDDWTFDIKWHDDPNKGHLNAYRNDVLVYGNRWVQTLTRPDQTNYLKIGLYLWQWPEGVNFRRYYFAV